VITATRAFSSGFNNQLLFNKVDKLKIDTVMLKRNTDPAKTEREFSRERSEVLLI